MLSYNKYKATTSSSERWRQPVGAPSASHWHDYIVVVSTMTSTVWPRPRHLWHRVSWTHATSFRLSANASTSSPISLSVSQYSRWRGSGCTVGFCRGWHSDVKIVEQRCHNSDTSARCQDGDWWPRWQHDDDVVITGMLTFSARQCHWHDDDHVNQGMTNYRRRPQRSITQDHRGSAIMG